MQRKDKIMTLFHIEIFAIIAASCGLACMIGMYMTRLLYTVKTKKHVDSMSEIEIAMENTKLTAIYAILTRIAMIFFIIAIIGIIIYSGIFSYAKQYGAYGDFYKKDTLSEIKQNIQYGFKDQSKDVPADPKGCIIIYYKWGCKDCKNIHDSLTAKLKTYDLFKTYFVSSRSDRGQKLLKDYAVDSVPSGVYIYYESLRNVTYKSRALNDGTKLDEYNLDALISEQMYCRCFELPDAYKSDAPAQIPKEYTDDYSESEDDIYDNVSGNSISLSDGSVSTNN